MNHAIDGLEAACAYMDDSHVSSPAKQTHLIHSDKFFATLAANGLTINLEKCVFAVPTLELLGHKISAEGLAPTAEHTTAIKSCSAPSGYQAIAMFLGMVKFYSHFLPGDLLVIV